jgi:hypothetical protein
MSEASDAYEIDPMAYVGSTIGNAFFSGVNMEQLFSCVSLADICRTPESLDAAVTATIRLNEIVEEHYEY